MGFAGVSMKHRILASLAVLFFCLAGFSMSFADQTGNGDSSARLIQVKHRAHAHRAHKHTKHRAHRRSRRA